MCFTMICDFDICVVCCGAGCWFPTLLYLQALHIMLVVVAIWSDQLTHRNVHPLLQPPGILQMVSSVHLRHRRGDAVAGSWIRWIIPCTIVELESGCLYVIRASWPRGDTHQDPKQRRLLWSLRRWVMSYSQFYLCSN